MISSCEIKGLYSTSIYVSAPVGSNHVNLCVCTCFCFILEVFCCFGLGFFATLACGIQLKAKYWIAHMRLRRQTPQLANRNATLPTLSARLRRSVWPLQKLPHSWWVCFTERTCYMGNIIFKAHKKRNIAFYVVVWLANESHSGEKKYIIFLQRYRTEIILKHTANRCHRECSKRFNSFFTRSVTGWE